MGKKNQTNQKSKHWTPWDGRSQDRHRSRTNREQLQQSLTQISRFIPLLGTVGRLSISALDRQRQENGGFKSTPRPYSLKAV